MKLIPPALRQKAIDFCREKFARTAVARREALPRNTEPVSVHMVVGHDMLLMGQLALRSFEFHTRQLWEATIHDDGTLTDADVADLGLLFPDATVVRRQEADQTLRDALVDFPVCR